MRLIDADALQELFNEVSTTLLNKRELTKDVEHMIRAFIMTTEMIKDAPTIDAEPVVHGRWIKRYEGLFDCSSCGVRMDLEGTPEEYLMHYCPNCGAKMDEVTNDDTERKTD